MPSIRGSSDDFGERSVERCRGSDAYIRNRRGRSTSRSDNRFYRRRGNSDFKERRWYRNSRCKRSRSRSYDRSISTSSDSSSRSSHTSFSSDSSRTSPVSSERRRRSYSNSVTSTYLSESIPRWKIGASFEVLYFTSTYICWIRRDLVKIAKWYWKFITNPLNIDDVWYKHIYMTELIKDNLSADLEFVWTLHSPLIWLHFEYFATISRRQWCRINYP